MAKLTDFDHSIVSDCSLVFSETTRIGGTLRWTVRAPAPTMIVIHTKLIVAKAPELLEKPHVSKQTDVYALGMVRFDVYTFIL